MKLLLSKSILLALGLTLTGSISGCRAEEQKGPSFAEARRRMIQTQLVPRGIDDPRVLAAFEKVERHQFVDPQYQPLAYGDHPLPIGFEQTISQPYIVAVMTQLLGVDSTDRILEVGTGSGYQAAILAELAKEVYTIEIIDTLAKIAKTRLQRLGYQNITVRAGDGYRGWPEKAPFDGIVVTCAPIEIPAPLVEQLAEGGLMVIPVGTDYQELMLLEKKGGKVSQSRMLPVRFVPMTGEAEKKK